MLPKKHKINRSAFPSYREQKRVWSNNSLRICCYLPDSVTKRFAVVVSKKQFATHVEKNRFKRVVLESIQINRDVFNGIPFGRFVIYPTRAVGSISQKDVREGLSNLFASYVSTRAIDKSH